MLLAIDVGNTDTKIGLWDGHEWIALSRASSSAPDTSPLEMAMGRNVTAVISSVVARRRQSLELDQAAAKIAPQAKMVSLHGGTNLGIEIRYRTPESLGPDRIANALAAMAASRAPAIVVDCGTATKLEAISGDIYLGGVIMPGLHMGAKALADGTERLPEVDLIAPGDVIGTDTSSAIRSGIMHGHAVAIDGMIAKFSAEMNADPEVFLTGGNAELLMTLCKTKMRLVPTLTLDGIVEAGRRLGLV